jgi:hypothetical protein
VGATAGGDAAGGELGLDAADSGHAADVPADVPPDLADAPPSPADVTPDLAEAGPAGPTITFTGSSSILHAPGAGGTAFSAACGGSNQALTGLLGTSGGVSGLNSVQGACGVIAVSGAPGLQLTTRPSTTLGPFGPVRPTRHDGSCPANQVVVGFEGASGSWINSLSVYCATLTITANATKYHVTVGAPTRVPTRLGTDGGTPFAARYCPAGEIAVGMLGASGLAIDRFGLYCARPAAQ